MFIDTILSERVINGTKIPNTISSNVFKNAVYGSTNYRTGEGDAKQE